MSFQRLKASFFQIRPIFRNIWENVFGALSGQRMAKGC